MLQTTHPYSMPAARRYRDASTGGASDEQLPLLYSVGSAGGQGYGGGSSYRGYGPAATAAAAAATQQQREEEGRPPTMHKCPRCSKEFLSTINQRRCMQRCLMERGGRAGRSGTGETSLQGAGLPGALT